MRDEKGLGQRKAETENEWEAYRQGLQGVTVCGAVQLGVGAGRVLQGGSLKNLNLQNAQLGEEGGVLLANMLTAKLQTNLQV